MKKENQCGKKTNAKEITLKGRKGVRKPWVQFDQH